MKSGKLAQVHRKGIKAGYHDQRFKETEQSSKEIRPGTSTDTVLKDTDDAFCKCITVDSARCGGKWYRSDLPKKILKFLALICCQ